MKLSIITINYNNCKGLQKTIDSVVSQTWHDFEWIVIDGGSTDGSKELIEKYQKYFAYWCSEPDKGIYNAMNKGIVRCSGEYISCMNSGDAFYNSNTLASVFLNKHFADIIYGDCVWSSRENGKASHFRNPVDIYELYYAVPCHQTMFVKTHLLKEEGFDESYQIVADYAKWVKLALQGCSFEYINLIICYYDTNGISNTLNEKAEEERKRVHNEIFPSTVIEFIKRHDYYKQTYEFVRVKDILEHGGITAKAFGYFISFVDLINSLKKRMR